MAINEETAALVAAQLTVAWATRVGPVKGMTGVSPSDAVFNRYADFFKQVKEHRSPG